MKKSKKNIEDYIVPICCGVFVLGMFTNALLRRLGKDDVIYESDVNENNISEIIFRNLDNDEFMNNAKEAIFTISNL